MDDLAEEFPRLLREASLPLSCQVDPALFDVVDRRRTRGATRAAKAVCERCPLVVSCAAWGCREGEWGIWGGTTVQERRKAGYPPQRRGVSLDFLK
ncbi:WhiB family transcriptional regulator [Streptomyces wuyuanensis]|uniref:WhiB family transcriptional regulator n=1 Tax=Streptomyces wuyuanensis TaxID=1196353 RepID=UPI003413B494